MDISINEFPKKKKKRSYFISRTFKTKLAVKLNMQRVFMVPSTDTKNL